MMQTTGQSVFKITPAIKREIVKIVDERIREAHVTKEDFSELKGIVKELGIKTSELAEAQKRTELRVEELAEAQKRTEIRLEELTVAIKELHGEIGGVGRSAGYALENEAYRHLPELLQGKYGIVVKEKMIRSQIGGKEINVFGRAARDGQDVLVVGEARTRLDERRGAEEAFEALEEKVQAVMAEYGQVEIVKILVTHFARKGFLDLAREKGIIVVQSFEW
ncbi:MAG: hypothetical protein ONB45_17015 [candidate division KSB1 bacterium]|nr:hypothetical protein [candidate division KSB1 bacterium]